KASTTKSVWSPGAASRPSPSARSPEVAAAAPCDSRGWVPAFRTPAPICDVTNTRSPDTIGDDTPTPARFAFHARVSAALHCSGRLRSFVVPLPSGPRHCGQSAALMDALAASPAKTAIVKVRIRKSLYRRRWAGAGRVAPDELEQTPALRRTDGEPAPRE